MSLTYTYSVKNQLIHAAQSYWQKWRKAWIKLYYIAVNFGAFRDFTLGVRQKLALLHTSCVALVKCFHLSEPSSSSWNQNWQWIPRGGITLWRNITGGCGLDANPSFFIIFVSWKKNGDNLGQWETLSYFLSGDSESGNQFKGIWPAFKDRNRVE